MSSTKSLIVVLCCGVIGFILFVLQYQEHNYEYNPMTTNVNSSLKAIIPDDVYTPMIARTNRSLTDNRTIYMTSSKSGRLGNRMFQYAVLFALTLNSSVWEPCINPAKYYTLIPLFETSLSIPHCIINFTMKNTKSLGDSRKNAEVVLPLLRALPHVNVSLHGYFQSHKYFTNAKNELRKEFRLPETLQSTVRNYFRNVTPEAWRNTSFVRVGIHVRRGDVVYPPRMRVYGTANCTTVYFSHAIRYFEAMYPRVQFIVTSDNIKWCQENISGKNVIFSNQNYMVDFGIATMSDHVIITVGSFSWWVGWLCTGTTIYNGRDPPRGTYAFAIEANNSWIPPDDEFNKWVPIQ